jgi:hypothetical protein
MGALTKHQESLVRVALRLDPRGFIPKPEDVAVCEQMADASVLHRLDGEDSEPPAYVANRVFIIFTFGRGPLPPLLPDPTKGYTTHEGFQFVCGHPLPSGGRCTEQVRFPMSCPTHGEGHSAEGACLAPPSVRGARGASPSAAAREVPSVRSSSG